MAGLAEAGGQTVSNVRAAQRTGTKLVDVYYDLSGVDSLIKLEVSVSTNGGVNYTALNSAQLTGDIGGWTTAGNNKHFVWNAGASWNEQNSDLVRFKLKPFSVEFTVTVTTNAFDADDPIEVEVTDPADGTKRKVTMYCGDYTVGETRIVSDSWVFDGNQGKVSVTYDDQSMTGVFNKTTGSFEIDYNDPKEIVLETPLVTYFSESSGHIEGVFDAENLRFTGEEVLEESTSWSIDARAVSCLAREGIVGEGQWKPSTEMVSSNITVDTRGTGSLTVTGRVMNGATKTPLAGVMVSLGGKDTASAANGTFTLANVNLAAGSILSASASGFVSQTRNVVAAADQKAVNVGDISLTPTTDKPVVESVKPDMDGIFLAGFGLIPILKATVDWNGTTPGSVQFKVNGSVYATRNGTGPEYSVPIPVDSALRTSLSGTGNLIAVTATAQEGKVSAPFQLTMPVVPLPAALQSGTKSSEGLNLKVKFSFPSTKPFGAFDIGPLGSVGGDMSVSAGFNYNIRSGAWKVEAGGKFAESDGYSAFRLKLGLLQNISAEIKAYGSGEATRTKGIEFTEFGTGLALSGSVPLGSFGLLGFLDPFNTALLTDSAELGKVFRTLALIVWCKPEFEGQLAWHASPQWNFKEFTFTGKVPVEAAYEPTLGKIKAKVYVGGDLSATFVLPGAFIRKWQGTVYVGVNAEYKVLTKQVKYVFLDVRSPAVAPAPALNPAAVFGEGGQVLDAAENQMAAWRAMPRPWRDTGGETFLPQANETDAASREASPPQAVGSGLDAFVSMGQSSEGGESKTAGVAARMIVANDPAEPVQAAFPLLSNVFPNSEPALASKGNELMLAYVRDTGAANPVQFTEVGYSYFDGATWTAPAPIASDARGQFSPQVVFDGAGNAVAVFERIKDSAFAGTVMEDMAALMEIVWSRWDAATQTWSVPQALTNNAYLDFTPKLSGPLIDGDLLLTWNQSETNQIAGTGAAGAAANLRVMTRRWDSATQTWGSADELVPNLTGELSESLGARGNKGVYVWTVDMDGNTDNSADAELYYRLYDATTGIWSPAVRHTTDAVVDHHAKAVVDAAGNAYAVWNRGGDLVMDVNFAGTPSVVRSGAGTLGVADFALTIGPAGNLALIWQEMTENGSDAHYRVYDPLSSTWGQDSFLSQDSDLERSFAPVWDAAGNLTLAYNNVVITKQTVNVDVEGGGTVSVDGVPQPGQVNLLLAKRTLIKDLSAVPEGLTADGTTFLPGDALTLKARVKNSGNLAVENVQVAFYDDDPAEGGTLIGTATVPGWLEAAADAEVTLAWTVPQPAQARTIHVKIDPASAVSESDETNNTLALPINGVDLALEYQSGSVLRDGSARVVVKVRNLSAPESPVTTLRLKAADGGATLAETSVSQLAPGQSVDIPFDLPAGTHPEGDRAYLLVIDEEDFASDIDLENNEAPFALNLWIDDDGDGIPRWWELANGMSDSDSGDALLDVDRDGFDALAEYLSGTDPRNAASRLGVGQFNVITNATTGETTSTVSWASVAGRLYRVERSFNLTTWQTVADDVEPLPPLNTLTDIVTPPGGRVFYRVVVK